MGDAFKSKKQLTGNYDVGYGKPPKSGQWQKGQSGNPTGRRKRELPTDWVDALHEAGQEVVTIRIGGKPRRMNLLQAAAYKACIDAAAGDARARAHTMRADEIRAQRNSLGETVDGVTTIESTLVFDGEEDRGWNKLAKDNEELRQIVEQLREQLSESGRS